MKNLLILVFPILIFFFPSLMIYFVQDDFWLLSISYIKTVGDFLNFFIPLPNAVWYRPLSSQVFFFLSNTIFGLNPLPYHVVVLITHIITTYILYKLIKRLTNNELLSLSSATIYSLNQIHTISLSWLAAYSFVLGPFFLVLTLFFFTNKNYYFAYLTFLLGILSTEVLIITPVILILFLLLYKMFTKLKLVLPYIFSSIILILFRFLIFPTQQNTQLYEIIISRTIFDTFKFYFLRLLGIPLFIDGMNLGIKILVTSLSAVFLIFILIGLIQNYQRISKLELLWLGIGIIALVPFLMFPLHVSPHYLSFALIGFSPFISHYFLLSISRRFRNILFIAIFACFLLLNFIGSQWTYETHWIFRRANLAKLIINEKKFIHPIGSEEYFALGANSAEQVFLH